jgi:hypothetical protein
MQFNVAGPAYTNALWYLYFRAYTPNAPNTSVDLYAYLPSSGASAQALEQRSRMEGSRWERRSLSSAEGGSGLVAGRTARTLGRA